MRSFTRAMRFVPRPLLVLLLLAVMAGRGSEASAAATATGPTTKPVDLKWQKLAEDSEFVKVSLPGNGGEVEALKVSLPQTGGTVRVLELTDPKITAESYAIEGKVKY